MDDYERLNTSVTSSVYWHEHKVYSSNGKIEKVYTAL